eukprot:2226998-Karenia_brevis.AAC.1
MEACCWKGHVLLLGRLEACDQSKYPLSKSFADHLTSQCSPEQFVFRDGGKLVNFGAASSYYLSRVEMADELLGVGWLLVSTIHRGQKPEAFFN